MSVNPRDRHLRVRPLSQAVNLSAGQVMEDLRRYAGLAIELGASASRVIDRRSFILDPRAQLKCRVPFCRNFGRCANYPPNSIAFGEMQVILERYTYGVLLRWDFTREQVKDAGRHNTELLAVHAAISRIEAAAFYDGHYLAAGFTAGNCKRAYCGDLACQALAEPGKGCRQPLKARPSMESVGFDVYRMASLAGWEFYPSGASLPDGVEKLARVGLVLAC